MPPSSFWIALGFLTRLPTPQREWNEQDWRDSIVWYGMVGAIIGSLLMIAAQSFNGFFPTSLTAGLVLLIWIGITGGLHLDGLADTADAWVGGLGDRERTLRIMKDPQAGPMGVIALIMCLLLKFNLIELLLQKGSTGVLFVAPILGRATTMLLMMTTPYARTEGLGLGLGAKRHPLPIALTFALIGIASIVCTSVLATLLMLATVALVFMMWRRMLMQRLGGTTGDTAGALLETVELVGLLIFVAV